MTTTNRLFSLLLLSAFLLAAGTVDAHAQRTEQRQRASAQEAQLVRSLDNITAWSRTILGERDDEVVVAMVPASEPLALQPGDVVASINDTSVNNIDGFFEALQGVPLGSDVTMKLLRSGEDVSITYNREQVRYRTRPMIQQSSEGSQ